MLVEFLCRSTFVYAWIALALVTLFTLTRVSAPYGRHAREGWGPKISARLGWFFMEIISPLAFLGCFLMGSRTGPAAIIFMVLYVGHYAYRSLIYPFLVPSGARRMPISVMLLAVMFNLVNGIINGGWLYVHGPMSEQSQWSDLHFLIGVTLMIGGFVVHVRADSILRNLRTAHGPGYHVPSGFLYRYVSCPNYLGEMVQWVGWAIAVNSLAGVSFAIWTVANLLPRALTHHRWYRDKFDDYPVERKAVIPFVL
jgi:3-oxo-5-alpha-steroid 4-dehydrogenase 1